MGIIGIRIGFGFGLVVSEVLCCVVFCLGAAT